MFKVLGVVLALYTVYSIVAGSVYAKSGPGGATVSRGEAPEYFWIVIVVYACLSVALLLYF